MGLLDGLEEQNRYEERGDYILRAPFSYPGGKSRSIKSILPNLPETSVYAEPFGGSGSVLLARKPSKLEVFNDRYAGVVAFYRCISDSNKMNKLIDRLELTVYSREDFHWCKDTWQHSELDDVERAARWFYMISTSFGSLGRNFGRTVKPTSSVVHKIGNKIKQFPIIHERFKNVQIENLDWSHILHDYDSHDTVFYCDPPYVDAYKGTYKYEMTIEDHQRFINNVFCLKGFVAISGYANPLYDNQNWDNRLEWDSYVSIQAGALVETNHKTHLQDIDKRGHAKEILWIKEAR